MTGENIHPIIDRLEALETELYQGDFLLTWERSRPELDAVLLAAESLEALYRANISTRAFDAGLAISNFRDKSTRTRFSFASAASMLGLSAQDLDVPGRVQKGLHQLVTVMMTSGIEWPTQIP